MWPIASTDDAIHKRRSTTQQWIMHFSQMIMQHIFTYNRLPWGATTPWLQFLESPCQADVQLTRNTVIYCLPDILFLQGQNFGFWGSPGGTAPKRGEDTPGTDMNHHAKFYSDRCHCRRDICNQTQQNNSNQQAIPYSATLRMAGKRGKCRVGRRHCFHKTKRNGEKRGTRREGSKHCGTQSVQTENLQWKK